MKEKNRGFWFGITTGIVIAFLFGAFVAGKLDRLQKENIVLRKDLNQYKTVIDRYTLANGIMNPTIIIDVQGEDTDLNPHN